MITHDRRKFLQLSAGALAAPMLARPTLAQAAWPAARPIRAISSGVMGCGRVGTGHPGHLVTCAGGELSSVSFRPALKLLIPFATSPITWGSLPAPKISEHDPAI